MRAKCMPSKQIVGHGLNIRYCYKFQQFPDSQVCLSFFLITLDDYHQTKKKKKRKKKKENISRQPKKKKKKPKKENANRSNSTYYALQAIPTLYSSGMYEVPELPERQIMI